MNLRLAFVASALLGLGAGASLGYVRPAVRPWVLEKCDITAETRVAYALRSPSVEATPEAWSELKKDVKEVRETIAADDRKLFDLVTAARGFEAGGRAEWGRAERICHELEFPRCDKKALSTLASQPNVGKTQ